MVYNLPKPDATFRVFPQDDKTYGVEISILGTQPTSVTSFVTEKAAEAWIVGYRRQVKAGAGAPGRFGWARRRPGNA
jgi:hypothetical protein